MDEEQIGELTDRLISDVREVDKVSRYIWVTICVRDKSDIIGKQIKMLINRNANPLLFG